MPSIRPQLDQNAPNPFNPATIIAYVVGRAGPVRLEIFNTRGQLLRVLVDGNLPAGEHDAVWNGETEDGRQAASGTYFYRLTTGDDRITRKMSLVK